jgi:hypothetical protein
VATKDGRRAPGTLEAEVMAVLWAAHHPVQPIGVVALNVAERS